MSYGDIDSWTIERDGITYRITIDPDYSSRVTDADCYSPSDVAAFERGDWSYVGVTVAPAIDGLDSDVLLASLWGVEWGTMPAETEPYEGGQHEEIVLDRAAIEAYPVTDLISEVRGRLATLRDTLTALPLDDCQASHLRTEGIPHPGRVHCERAAGHTPPHRVMDYTWEDC